MRVEEGIHFAAGKEHWLVLEEYRWEQHEEQRGWIEGQDKGLSLRVVECHLAAGGFVLNSVKVNNLDFAEEGMGWCRFVEGMDSCRFVEGMLDFVGVGRDLPKFEKGMSHFVREDKQRDFEEDMSLIHALSRFVQVEGDKPERGFGEGMRD